MNDGTTLENFGEKKLRSLFPGGGQPLIIPIGHPEENRTTLEEIIKAAKIAQEQRLVAPRQDECQNGDVNKDSLFSCEICASLYPSFYVKCESINKGAKS